jgi:hypothetical protein
MPDVFVVAVLILKSDSTIIIPKPESDIALFAISVILMMSGSFIARKIIVQKQVLNK